MTASKQASASSLATNRDTPMIRQYLELKEQVPDCLLFFRMGDFYEMFFEDAEVGSRVLGIALTTRDRNQPDPIPMCGVPYRAVNAYLAKMVDAGFKVAVCDQVEDPRQAKGLVKRDITRVVTPGMFIDPEHIPGDDNLFLAALYLARDQVGLSFVDLSSGEFMATVVPYGPAVSDELARMQPAELVVAESQVASPALAEMASGFQALVRTSYAGRPPSPRQALESLDLRVPNEFTPDEEPALVAAAMAWSTVLATQRCQPEHVERLGLYQVDSHLVLDAGARRNLELYTSIAQGGRKGSLVHAVDRTSTPMGARLLKQWLGFPLLNLALIEARHQAVEELCSSSSLVNELSQELGRMPDLPRLVGRVNLGQATPRDLAGLRDGLDRLPGLAGMYAELPAPLIQEQAAALLGLEDLTQLLKDTLVEEPPISLAEGGIIAPGVDQALDQARAAGGEGKTWIAGLQNQLRASTGIGSLKVGFNKVFGYYIEVTRTHLDKVPEDFIRKQTLAGAERFITSDLKEKEAAVLGAQERALELERTAFEQLREKVAAQSEGLMACARALAVLDVLAGLAKLALSQQYVRPEMAESGELVIEGGRHPVVEQMLKEGDFVPNDLTLNDEQQQVLIITGPNMAGKSTILRQTALIAILAQAGSFVPASRARLPLVDRVFTRVGAMDDLARGRSTFMVEMTETSQILKQATPRSLVILDEVGRGTSTYDGLSLAWSVAEYLHDLEGRGVKTLFATHYHELTELAATHPRAKNFNVAVKEYQGTIVFLRKLAPGGVSRSYGLAVARLAGLPEEVINRAKTILERLEADGAPAPTPKPAPEASSGQLSLFSQPRHPVLTRLEELSPEKMTPLQALQTLDELKRALEE